jgi:carbamoyl-phosphate synthase large subunit
MPRARKSRVLFVGGGRRIGLAKAFMRHNADIYGYESTPDVPLADIAKRITVGVNFSDPECGEDIRRVVKVNRITHIVPLMDAAAVVCGDMPECIGSPERVAALCMDKRRFARWIVDAFPEVYPAPTLFGYPKVAKPRYGRSSRGIEVLQFPSAKEWSDQWCIQDYAVGEEISVDLFYGHDGCKAAVARTRTRVEGGEVVESTVIDGGVRLTQAILVCNALGVRGPVNVQFVGDKLIEVNARFGGGAVLSIAAGVDMAAMALGIEVPSTQPAIGLTMQRYHAESFR